MKITLFISTLFLLRASAVFACCGETNYRLFPIGHVSDELLFVEFNLARNCKQGTGAGPENEFWISGTINLMSYKAGSLALVQNLDTVNVIECICTYPDHYQKTEYESMLATGYHQGLIEAKRIEGFQIAEPKSIVFNDSLNTRIIDSISDTSYSYIVDYKDLIAVDLGMEEISSCYPDKVAEVRAYDVGGYRVTVLRLRCHFLESMAVSHNEIRFSSIGTAFWKEQAQWHGIAKDYLVVEEMKD